MIALIGIVVTVISIILGVCSINRNGLRNNSYISNAADRGFVQAGAMECDPKFINDVQTAAKENRLKRFKYVFGASAQKAIIRNQLIGLTEKQRDEVIRRVDVLCSEIVDRISNS